MTRAETALPRSWTDRLCAPLPLPPAGIGPVLVERALEFAIG